VTAVIKIDPDEIIYFKAFLSSRNDVTLTDVKSDYESFRAKIDNYTIVGYDTGNIVINSDARATRKRTKKEAGEELRLSLERLHDCARNLDNIIDKKVNTNTPMYSNWGRNHHIYKKFLRETLIEKNTS